MKLILIFASIPIIFFSALWLNEFQTYLDYYGNDHFIPMLKNLPRTSTRVSQLLKYIHTEYFFFGAGSIILAIILPIRMVISIWRQKNRGTV